MTFKDFLIKECTETVSENFPTGFDRVEIHQLAEKYANEQVQAKADFISRDIKPFPKTGEEFLTRNANQNGNLKLMNWNTIHNHWESKGKYVYLGTMPTHWLKIY